MRIAWLTDIHMNFVTVEGRRALIAKIIDEQVDAVMLGGDIGEGKSIEGFLRLFDAELNFPIYFVLGNHDYYHSNIDDVHRLMHSITETTNHLHWLPQAGVIRLADEVALVGHGGWGDARSGDFANSDVVLNDYLLIRTLRDAVEVGAPSDRPFESPEQILNPQLESILNQFGDEAAERLGELVTEAVDQYERVIVLMHVPPFREACWHEGRTSDDNWAPHFVCESAGEVLKKIMADRPDRNMAVLCGHTHGAGEVRILPNLHVITGGATYGSPEIQRVFEF